jgi:PAS domain S-box-containing protein
MKYNKLLENQIENALSDELRNNKEVMKLLNVISNTYTTFENRYNLLENTFKINEEDFIELNKKLQESYQNMNANIRATLDEVERLISSFSNLDSIEKLIENIKTQIDNIAENDSVGLYFFDEEENRLRLFFAKGFNQSDIEEAEKSAMNRHPGYVYSTGNTLFVKDQNKEHNIHSIDFKENIHTGSRMYVPVKSGEKIIGAFGLQSKKVGAFSENQLSLLKVFTALSGNAYINISKNKLIEKQNQENAKLSILARSTSNNIIYTDKDGMITWVNKAFEKKTGYKLQEILGKKPGSFLCGAGTEPESTERLIDAIKNKKECNVTITNYKKSGIPFKVDIQISPVFNEKGDLINYVSIQQDVTERENQRIQNEFNLRRISRSEEKYSKLLNSTSDVILITDKAGNITFCNKAWQDKFENEISIGKNIIDYLHPNSKLVFIDHFESIEQNHLTSSSVKFLIQANTSSVFELEGDIYSSFIDDNLFEHNFFLKDVTEINLLKRKTAEKEKEIEKYNSSLIELTSTNFLEYNTIGEVARIISFKANQSIAADFVYIGKYDSEQLININTYIQQSNTHQTGVSINKIDFPNYFKLLRKKLFFILSDFDKSTIIPQLLFVGASTIKTVLNIPIKINDNLWGVISFASVNANFEWNNELISFAKSVGDIFGSVASTYNIRENNQKLANVLNSLNETIWGVKLPEYRLEFISKSAEALYGLPLESWFSNINLWKDFIHPEDRAEALKQSELLYKHNTTEQEYRIITPDNKTKWISNVTRLIRDKDGVPVMMTGISKDITSIKESGIELVNYKKSIYESAVVSGTDLSGKILFVNDKFCQLSGYTQEELIGANHNILSSGFHSQEFFGELWKTISDGKIWRGEIKNKAKNGHEYYVDISIVPFMKNGKPSQYIAIQYDCTERVIAKEILKKQKDFYEVILDNIPVDIAVFDLKHNYKYLNKEAVKDKEIRNWLVGKNDFDYAQLKGIDIKMAESRRAKFNEVIESSKPVFWIDSQTNKNGELNHKERRFFVDKANDFVIGYGVNITDLMEKEKQLSASIEEKEALLGEIHHRVKNNLALVVGLIEMEVFRSTDKELVSQLKAILKKITAIGLIHEKLYKSGNFSNIDMPGYIKDFVQLSMEINQESHLPAVNYEFDQILLNAQQAIPLALCLNELLINSYKHAFENNPAPAITICLKNDGDDLIFEYSDNGKGLKSGTDIKQLTSLGFKLILIFIKQLKGVYTIENTPGLTIKIRFKNQPSVKKRSETY